MRLLSLTLEQFRNYASLDLDLAESAIHLFAGENGSGKTNLLEAVSVASLTKSCRGRDDGELVTWGRGHYRVRVGAESDAGSTVEVEVVYEAAPRKRKAFFLNDVRVTASRIVGAIPAVIFLPQDLELFSGPPAERRRFLDQLLSQVSPDYLFALSAYQKVLAQRNALLKRVAAGEEVPEALDLWDAQLAAQGSAITLARLELLETLNLSFPSEFSRLGEAWEDVSLVYERRGEGRDQRAIEEEMRSLLAMHRERDILLQSTSAGPHREDWQVVAGGRPVPTFASRGQERTAVLALLLLEVSYIELKRSERPVVLLDDAFSELDEHHQASLLASLEDHQVLLTSTRVPPRAEAALLWSVEAGMVTRFHDARVLESR